MRTFVRGSANSPPLTTPDASFVGGWGARVLAEGPTRHAYSPTTPLVAAGACVVLSVALAAIRARSARARRSGLSPAVRERIALAAAEAERAKLSRDLHDGSLHALAAVIRRLERHPGTEPEREALREVAAQLRVIATDLHPPILDDFGLVPALEALARDDDELSVVVTVDAAGCSRADRPPEDVEIGAYRVVQEALANAVTHSGTSAVTIRGRVAADALALAVTDEGAGFRAFEVETAMRAGHLGVASMRRRAEAIDARLDVRSVVGTGTTVQLEWPA